MLFPLPYVPSIPHPLNLVSGVTASLNLLSLISTLPSVLPDPLKHLLFYPASSLSGNCSL